MRQCAHWLAMTWFFDTLPPREGGVVFACGAHDCCRNPNDRQVAIGTFSAEFNEKPVAQLAFKIIASRKFSDSGKPSFYIGINIFL